MIDRAKGCELYVLTKKTQRLQKRKRTSPQRPLPTYSYTVYIADAVKTKDTSFTGDDVNSPFFDDRHPPPATCYTAQIYSFTITNRLLVPARCEHPCSASSASISGPANTTCCNSSKPSVCKPPTRSPIHVQLLYRRNGTLFGK